MVQAAKFLDGFASKRKAKLQEASTHKSAKTHAGNVFVTRDLDL